MRNEVNKNGSAGDVFTAALNKAEKVVDSAPIVKYYCSSLQSDGNGGYTVSVNDNGKKQTLNGVDYTTAINTVKTTGGINYDINDFWYQPYDWPYDPRRIPIDTTPWVPQIWRDYPSWGKSELQRFIDDIHDLTEKVPNKLPSSVVSSSFPPSNLFISETKDLYIQIACAGYPKENVSIVHENDYLIVKLTKPETMFKTSKDKDDNSDSIIIQSYLQKGIKLDDGELKFYIDPKKYDAEQAKVKFENGMITILIPKDEKVDKKTILQIE